MNRRSASATENGLYYALLFATAAHGAMILGLDFDMPAHPPLEPEQSLEITVVRPQQPAKPPEKAQFLADASQEGSGNIEEVAKPTVNPALQAPATVQTALHNQTDPSPPPQPERPEPMAEEPRIAAEKPEAKTPKTDPGESSRRPRVTAQELLANMQKEIASLTAELDQKTRLYAQRPKRKAINASTREHKYAAYLESWRRKVEYVGNLNYPDDARRHKIYGDLILHVAVKANGSVEQIRVIRSSGHSVLDDAAVGIVRLAAPFAPFPPDIKKEVDVLDITRTWQFLRGDRLGSR